MENVHDNYCLWPFSIDSSDVVGNKCWGVWKWFYHSIVQLMTCCIHLWIESTARLYRHRCQFFGVFWLRVLVRCHLQRSPFLNWTIATPFCRVYTFSLGMLLTHLQITFIGEPRWGMCMTQWGRLPTKPSHTSKHCKYSQSQSFIVLANKRRIAKNNH